MSSPIISDLMKRVYLIGSLAVIATGIIFVVVGAQYDDTVSMAGAGVVFIGFIFLVTGFTNKSVTETKEAKGLSLLMIAGSGVAILGLISIEAGGFMAMSIGGILIILSCIMWPCFCCQGGKNIQSQIVGVVSSHDSISIDEVSKITGHSEDTIRKTVYDAIGKRILHGRMEGNTFHRSAPSAPAYRTSGATTTKEREIVTVLVICPYCGAKTQQGVSKCQNCQADL